jgi:hypothetical protein
VATTNAPLAPAGRQPAAEPMTKEEFASWTGTLPERFVRCRDLGHRWRTTTVEWVENDRLYHRNLRCSECGTVRVQNFGYDGAVLSNSYIYPEGYQAPAGVGRLDAEDRGQIRLVSLQRVIMKQTTAKAS